MQKNEELKKSTDEKEGKERFGRLKKLIRDAEGRDENAVRTRLGNFVGFFLTVAVSYFVSGAELLFGTYPGAAGLMLVSKKRLLPVLIGLLLSVFFGELPWVYGYICLVTLLVRILAVLLPAIYRGLWTAESENALIPYKADAIDEPQKAEEQTEDSVFKHIFVEEIAVRLLCGAVGGMICGLLILIERSFSMYSLFATLFLVLAVPLLGFCFLGCYGESTRRQSPYFALSLGALCFLAVWSAKEGSIFGMPLSPCLALLLSLYATTEYGFFYGLGAAVLSGLSFDPRYILLLLLSVLILEIFSKIKKSAGVAAVCGLVVLWCYYLGGEGGLLYVLPPMLLSLPLYMVADKYREMMRAPYRRPEALAEGLYFAEAVVQKTKNEEAKDRLASLSEAFDSLSENFYKLSDRFRRPDLLGLKQIADRSFEDTCRDCRNRALCHGSEYASTVEAISGVAASLHKKGSLKKEELPEKFAASCLRCDELVECVNRNVGDVTEKTIKAGKASFFASNYEDITAILDAALDCDPEEYECDTEAGGKIFDLLYGYGLTVGGVAVYGKRCLRVIVQKIGGLENLDGKKSRQVGNAIGELLGESLSEPVFEVGKDGNTMLLYARPKVSAFCAHGRLTGEEGVREEAEKTEPFESDKEALCGDMTDAFITDNSYFYSLISDGMGSGAEAAYTANVSAMFIEKMLSAGNRADVTLRMLNNVIRSENLGCGNECSATVDLLELDLMNGTASFIKSGAAPTYIAREGTVYKISARTMPVGIIQNADARITKFDTRKGDIIVMVSDGCCPDNEDCPWLVEYLCALMSKGKMTVQNGEALCEKMKREIIEAAVANFPKGKERDDISVSVVVVG